MSHLDGTLARLKEELSSFDMRGKTILDVGCRDVSAKSRLEELGLIWTGIDKEPKDNPIVRQMDMTQLEYAENEFDFIFICHSLEHCENPIQALREFKRVVKPTGCIFISLPCHCMHHILESDEDHIFCFTEFQITRLLIYCGYKHLTIAKEIRGFEGTDRWNLIALATKGE